MTCYKDRPFCYTCNRSQSACVCHTITPVETQSHFVLLLHPKEARKTRNNTGRITKASLSNSSLFVGIDFSEHQGLNMLLNDPKLTPFILYPGSQSHNLSEKPLLLRNGTKALFIFIDSTWACSKKILRLSRNLHNIPRVSFQTQQSSIYAIKKQPNPAALSTIESAQVVLSILTEQGLETLQKPQLQNFLNPFKTLIAFQKEQGLSNRVRYK